MSLVIKQMGYSLLEVLAALSLLAWITTLSLRYQTQLLQRSAQQFQELTKMNEQHNAVERNCVIN